MADDIVSSCESCGASVYRQHLELGIARYEGGKLLCSHCVQEYEASHDETGKPGVARSGGDYFEPIALDDEGPTTVATDPRIKGFSTATLGVGRGQDDSRFARPLNTSTEGATRCRSFHAKLSEPALEFMNNQINDWVDANPGIVIKFATSTIGTFEGKHAEPNLIVTVFY